MSIKRIGFVLAVVALASCSSFEKESTSKTPVTETAKKPAVKVAERKKINIEALADASERSGKQDAASNQKSLDQAKARAERDAQAKAAAERIAKEEQANSKEAQLRAQQEAEETAKKQEAARLAAEKLRAEKAAKAQALLQQQAAAEAAALAKAEALKAQQEEQQRQIAIAAEKTRREAEAKALAEKTSQEASRQEAQAKAAAEAKASAEQQKAAAAEQSRQQAAKPQSSSAQASFSVSNFKGAQLDSENYTPMGAERKGNADGTIPAWTGKMRSAPRGIAFTSGDVYLDPYANDKILFTIRANSMDKYANHLSEGLKMMFRKYPDTFAMNIYPSHRDGRYSDIIEERTKWNSTHTKMVNGVDGLQNYTGGAPFPFPKNAGEVMWNGRIIHPTPTVNGVIDDIAVYLNGNWQQRRQTYVSEFPFAYLENPVGKADDAISVNAAYVHVTTELPDRQKGQMTVIHEALDQAKNERMAWVYIPGSRRVRRAPTVGYDTPDGPGGLITVDDALGFNGAFDRYEWKLLGKKEMYIPYHSYKFDDPKVSYKTLLHKGHANPDYMRYELHRVWVVEANLKANARHVYVKRRFYIDEDSWHIVLTENYDGRGDLWRVGILNTVYDYAVKGFVARAQMFHDLQSGGYIAMRLVNETAPMRFLDTPKGEGYYSPASLRTLGR